MYDESGDKSKAKVDRVKVVDTEDCSRGPLSGCIRLADSSRVIQRLKVSILERQFACHAFVLSQWVEILSKRSIFGGIHDTGVEVDNSENVSFV